MHSGNATFRPCRSAWFPRLWCRSPSPHRRGPSEQALGFSHPGSSFCRPSHCALWYIPVEIQSLTLAPPGDRDPLLVVQQQTQGPWSGFRPQGMTSCSFSLVVPREAFSSRLILVPFPAQVRRASCFREFQLHSQGGYAFCSWWAFHSLERHFPSS